MSAAKGFVITVSCEDFFNDARKSVALFFNLERLRTVNDLKQRLRMLVNSDFYVLWCPSDENSYYYLLDDEILHFVKSKDKFRICKMTESSTELFNKNVYNQAAIIIDKNILKDTRDSEKNNENHKTNGTLDSTRDDDILMEYEDVVDEGSKKKRKRTRKHKSKRQKLYVNIDKMDVSNATKSTNIPDKVVHCPTDNVIEENSRSHIHFETDNLNVNDQVNANHKIITLNQSNGEITGDEKVRKKDKKKSKKKKHLIPSHEMTEESSSQEQNESITCSITTPQASFNVGSLNDSKMDKIATSTAFNTPIRVPKKPAKRKPYSLANFISQLSDSLKKSPNINECDDNNSKEMSVMKKETSGTTNIRQNPVILNNTEVKFNNETSTMKDSTKTKSINISNGYPTPSTKSSTTASNSSNHDSSEHSNSDRKLWRNPKKSNDLQWNGNQISVLENLKQLQYSNYPNMPLVFERNSFQSKKDIAHDEGGIEQNGVKEINNETTHLNGYEEGTKNIATNGTFEVANTLETRTASSDVNYMLTNMYEQLKEMTEEEFEQYPLLKEPTENAPIIFKVLKMDSSYNPSLSNYVGAVVRSICKSTNQLSLLIGFGSEELKPPKGKFSLEDEENDVDEAVREHSINWNEMFHARGLHTQVV